jgi:hypothetical protein
MHKMSETKNNNHFHCQIGGQIAYNHTINAKGATEFITPSNIAE